ncbi:MAG: hypothetical protein IJY90_00230 [Clostridia bacterium]|nr:hypothetical protein [Clostridia bacterium]
MNDIKCLLALGAGMIAGAMLYKYSNCAKKIVDQGEKKVMQEVDSIEKQAKQSMEKAEKKMK